MDIQFHASHVYILKGSPWGWEDREVNTMEEYLQGKNLCLFFKALRKVEAKYAVYMNNEGSRDVDFAEHCEHVFTYELYRQWANLLKRKERNLTLNAEPNKFVKRFFSPSERLKEVKKDKAKYPDLVLHKGQEAECGNIIVCEIKRASQIGNGRLKGDIRKLSIFTNTNNGYRWGIQLIYGCKPRKYIKPIFNFNSFRHKRTKEYYSKLPNTNKILIVSLEFNESRLRSKPEIKFAILNDILNNKDYETFTINHSLCAMCAGGACPVQRLGVWNRE